MKRITRVSAVLWIGSCLGGDSLNPDMKREQQYSDRLRKAQREYIRIMDEFDRWCSSHGQRVGAKGAQGDLGCVSPQTQSSTAAPAGRGEEKK